MRALGLLRKRGPDAEKTPRRSAGRRASMQMEATRLASASRAAFAGLPTERDRKRSAFPGAPLPSRGRCRGYGVPGAAKNTGDIACLDTELDAHLGAKRASPPRAGCLKIE